MGRRLILIAVLGLTIIPSLSSARYAKTCAPQWGNAKVAWTNLVRVATFGPRQLTDEDFAPDRVLAPVAEAKAKADKAYAKAKACTPDADLTAQQQKSLATNKADFEEVRGRAMALLDAHPVLMGFVKEAKTLLADIWASHGENRKALFDRAMDLDTRIKAALPTHPGLDPDWHAMLFDKHVSRAFSALNTRDAARKAAAAKTALLATAVVSQAGTAYTIEDAYDPKKTRAALLAAPLEHFAYIVKDATPDYGNTPKHRKYTKTAKDDEVWVHMTDTGMRSSYRHNHPLKPADFTQGIVWAADGDNITFVTLDGGVYTDSASEFALGLTPPDNWMKAPINAGLISGEIPWLAEHGVLPAKLGKDYERYRTGAHKCINKTWDRFAPKFKAIKRKVQSARARKARIEAMRTKARKAAASRCKAKIAGYTRTWKAATKVFGGERRKTLDAVKARLEAEVAKLPK